ncbi:MAG: exodeoxyribonuclease I [Alkalispirochaetaceae bacterium]
MSYLWYDLETFGTHPRLDRIAQFAALRTDYNLQPVEEPVVLYCRIPRDYLPHPEAVRKTGITPQVTRERGVREIDFAREIRDILSVPGTCTVGFNSFAFDDEFLRALFYRNFIDPYEREYRNGNSRWDVLNLVRIAHDLRPEGVNWPRKEDGRPDFRLEALTEANGIEHSEAHDALADVRATVAVAELIRKAQPKLYEFLLTLRDREEAKRLIDLDRHTPIVQSDKIYTRPGGASTVVAPLTMDAENSRQVLVYDLRYDPTPFLHRSVEELRETAFRPRKEQPDEEYLPVTRVALNRAPAIAPASTLDEAAARRLGIKEAEVEKHLEILRGHPAFVRRIRSAFAPTSPPEFRDPEDQLYAGFLPDSDRSLFPEIHRLQPRELIDWEPPFRDPRLSVLLHRLKMRNFEEYLTPEERREWYREAARRILLPPSKKLTDMEEYELRVEQILNDPATTPEERRSMEALRKYGQSVRATLPIQD